MDFHQFELKEKEEEDGPPSQRPSMEASLSGELLRADNLDARPPKALPMVGLPRTFRHCSPELTSNEIAELVLTWHLFRNAVVARAAQDLS